jgi:hypothetical protein
MPSSQEQIRHYLVYWRPKNAELRLARHPLLNHAGSSQFRHTATGDVLWFVTVRMGKLVLLGRLAIGRRTDWNSAVELLGHPVSERSRYVVIALPGTEEFMRDVSLEDITTQIRFESPTKERLNVVNGQVNPQQMQMKRTLTHTTSLLFQTQWASAQATSDIENHQDS